MNEDITQPHIETKRLALRTFKADDLDAAYKLFSDPDVQKYLSPKNRRSREQLQNSLKKLSDHWRERGFGVFCITEKGFDEMVGYCGFQYFDKTKDVEILFAIQKEHWRKGFATEAAKGCLEYGFEKLRFKKVYAATHPKNIASRFVIEKLGMKYDEVSTHYEMNLAVFSISSEQFQSFKKC